MTDYDCPICRIRADRIAELEERLERAEQAREADIMHPPHEWCLGACQAVIARRLAKGPVSTAALGALLEESYPTQNGRAPSHIRVLVSGLRRKISDFGWVVERANSHSPIYRVLPFQLPAFQAALRGDGSYAHPVMTAKSLAA